MLEEFLMIDSGGSAITSACTVNDLVEGSERGKSKKKEGGGGVIEEERGEDWSGEVRRSNVVPTLNFALVASLSFLFFICTLKFYLFLITNYFQTTNYTTNYWRKRQTN